MDGPLRLVGSTQLRDGHMRIIVAASLEAAVGAACRLTVELRPQGRADYQCIQGVSDL